MKQNFHLFFALHPNWLSVKPKEKKIDYHYVMKLRERKWKIPILSYQFCHILIILSLDFCFVVTLSQLERKKDHHRFFISCIQIQIFKKDNKDFTASKQWTSICLFVCFFFERIYTKNLLNYLSFLLFVSFWIERNKI